MPKSDVRRRYKINNWAEYNRSLVQRGSLSIWVEEGAIDGWLAKGKPKKQGRPQTYSDEAILMLLVLREVYRLPLRGLQGMAASLFLLMGLSLPVPCYSQICRRAQKLGKVLKRLKRKGYVDVVFDSTGLKVYGEGEWKVRAHGIGKRRTWKKLHVGIDPATQEILVCELTDRDGGDAATGTNMLEEVEGKLRKVYGDGAYDGSNFREAVQKRGVRRSRTDAIVEEMHDHGLSCVDQKQWKTEVEIGTEEIEEALAMTYRARRWSEKSRISSLETTKVTLAADLMRFSKN